MNAPRTPDPLSPSRETWQTENRQAAGDPSKAGNRRQVRTLFAKRALRFLVRFLLTPFRGYASIRRSMTAASVWVLLMGVMTLNVIWGFPWSGMMGGAIAMLLVGFIISRIMRPRLRISLNLPRSASAGQPFSISVRLSNPRFLPAMRLRVGWHREGILDQPRKRGRIGWDASSPVAVPQLRGGDEMRWHGSMRFDRRGIHDLPPFEVVSAFPFFLFYSHNSIDPQTQIAITPAPATSEDDPTARMMLAAIGDWAQALIGGAPVEYVGNREYEVGMAVRRWDFASWARLGRPIVREYQSPSIQSVTLIIDTSFPHFESKQPNPTDLEDEFERLMSIAATALTDIASRNVQLRLYLTSESLETLGDERAVSQTGEATELMLVRLAKAHSVPSSLAEDRICEVISNSRSQPILVLSLHDWNQLDRGEILFKSSSELPVNVNYLTIPKRSEKGVEDSFSPGSPSSALKSTLQHA